MIEFIKCLATGLAVFAGIGVVIVLIHFAGQMWPAAFPWAMSAAFALGMALWLGAMIRGDL